MPKSTHFHQVRDTQVTDKKFRPEDEGIYQEEKHELQGSEQDKKAEPVSEDDFIREQDRKSEQDRNANGDKES
jgi:hypothetical protein